MSNMRLEIPHATSFFVHSDAVHDPHTVEGALALWAAFDQATKVTSELKSDDWILEDRSELSEEFVKSTWSLTADLPEFADYVKIETDRGVVRFFGSATTTAHHTLGRLAELLAEAGWERFDDFTNARVASNRRRSRPNSPTRIGRRNSSRAKSLKERQATVQAAGAAAREGFSLFRNMMVIGFAVSVFVGTEVLRPAVIMVTISSLLYATAAFILERSIALAYKKAR